MNLLAVIRWLGLAILALAAAMVLATLSCVLGRDWDGLSTFALSILVCVTVGGGLVMTSFGSQAGGHAKAGIREMIVFLLLWWVAIPVIGGMPFLFQGMTITDAWFEAVSGMTTTGAWLSGEKARESYAMMLWRAELQWLGGLISIASAAAVFVRPQFIGIDIVNTPFARGEDESFLRAFSQALYSFVPAYALISLAIFLMMVIGRMPAPEALVVALSLTASGGFIPDPEGFAGYGPVVQAGGFVALMLGGVSIVSMAKMMAPSEKALRFRDDRETPVFFVLVFLLAFIYAWSIDHHPLQHLGNQLLNAASLLSTNGIISGDAPALTPALVTAIIGGASISAAGGIKLIRWLVTFERAGEEIWKLIHPNGVLGKPRAINELGVWVHFVAFTIILSGLVLLITIYGTPLELSVTTAVAVISNSGPMIVLAPGDVVDYGGFHPHLRFALAFGMIIGRLEMVIALAILNTAFWRG